MTWQTARRTNAFTRLDFRTKLALMAAVTLVAFTWESPFLGGLLTLATLGACLAAGVDPAYVRTVFFVMLPFYLVLVLTYGFFSEALLTDLTGEDALTPLLILPESWPLVGGASLSLEGALYALNVAFKTLTMILVLPLVVFTTDVNAMVVGLVKARVPYKLAFIFSSTLRFFPLLFQETRTIVEAQRLRGLAVEEMGPLQRVRVYAKVAVPLILGAMAKAQMLEVVLQSKAFSGGPRTYLHESALGAADYLVMALSALLAAAALAAYFALGFGRFGSVLNL
jgi:energy-coupling factor transport system permease protein